MEKEKGILGRLLAGTGALLIIAGVFAFQGMSHADESEGGGVETGAIVSIPEKERGESLESQEGDTESGDVEEDTNEHSFSIKYYREVANEETENTNDEDVNGAEDDDEEEPLYEMIFSDVQSGEDMEITLMITDFEPEGEGDFLAWYDPETKKYYTAGDEITLDLENPELKLVAKFAVLKKYVLKYSANGGKNAPKAQTLESYLLSCDFTISNETPSREGYEFRGWKLEGDDTKVYQPGAEIQSESFEEPLMLYAVWAEIKTYTLIYDVNGGSGTPAAQSCKSADGVCKFIISDVEPSRKNFGFLGWQRGEETYAANSEIIVTETNTVLMANWNPIYHFTLNYETEGKNVENMPGKQECETAEGSCTFIVPENEPEREGYKFKGWRFEDQPEMVAKAGDSLVVAIDGELNLKIQAVWSQQYLVLNSGEVFGAGERVVLRSSAGAEDFSGLTIDSMEVPEDYYTMGEGTMTSVVLGNAFSQSLNSGEHGFEIAWKDGEASGIISVNQNEDGTKRFVVVDADGSTEGMTLMSRPKAGAVSRESSGVTADSATSNEESGFDAVKTLIIVAVGAFIVVYIVNKFYIKRKMDFIENF